MALNDVVFVKGQGGLGRPLAGEDHYSAILFYTASLPSGFTSSSRIKQVFSTEDAEDLGIVNTYSDETKAVAKVAIAGTPAIGDTLKVTYTDVSGTVVNVLPTYALVSGEETTTTTAAAAYAAQINANTFIHGFSATSSSANLLITTKAGEGVYPNSGTPYVATATGGNTGTVTQPTGSSSTVLGVASQLALMHYHISEFFRVQPKGVLWIGVYAVPSTYTFSEITTMQNFTLGKIRQMAIYSQASYDSSRLTTIQTVLEALDTAHKPISSVLFAGDISATSNLSTLANLATLTAYKTSVVIGQDGGGLGLKLYNTTKKSITCIGATLGAVALATVSQDIAWKGKFNLSNGLELDTLAFGNGQLFTDLSDGTISYLNDLRYVFLLKNVGSGGSYFNDSHTAIAVTSDYAYIENNRTIDKAIRGAYASLLPEVAAPIQLNANGTISDVTIAHLISVASPNLEQMVRDGDLSAFEVTINPAQDVLSTSKIIIAIGLLPKGVSRMIQVNIGFVTSI